jgi:ribosomal protein S14
MKAGRIFSDWSHATSRNIQTVFRVTAAISSAREVQRMKLHDRKRSGRKRAAQVYQCQKTAKPPAHNRYINLSRRCVNPSDLLA